MLIFHWECLTINACFPENSFHFISGNTDCSKITGSTASMSVTREKGMIIFMVHINSFWRRKWFNGSCVMEACVISTRTASCDAEKSIFSCTTSCLLSKAASEETKLITHRGKVLLDFPALLTLVSSLYILNCVPETAVGSCTGKWQPAGYRHCPAAQLWKNSGGIMTMDLLPVQASLFCQCLLNRVKQFEDSGCPAEARSSEFAGELVLILCFRSVSHLQVRVCPWAGFAGFWAGSTSWDSCTVLWCMMLFGFFV